MKELSVNIASLVHKILEFNGVETMEKSSPHCPITIMSFQEEDLHYFKLLTNLPRIYLIWKLNQIPKLDIPDIANGVGVDLKLLWDKG